MKKVLLISNKVHHYRSRIYNVFFDMFKEMGYEFHVISNEYQKVKFPIRYVKHEKPFSTKGYINAIKEIAPDVCINFLHLKDNLIFPLTFYCKWKKIPMIYWGHGINLRTPDAKIKNLIFKFIHNISNAIILYSTEQLKYISANNQKKTFIAKNTLSFEDTDISALLPKEQVKEKYNIKERKVLMYISRILPYKGLDILLDNFKDVKDLALVVVGGGISAEQRKIIDSTAHYYYLGERYDKEVDEIYNMGDIFSTPGHIGLAVNQSMFFGKPIVVLNRKHAPEITYLHNGENGYMVDTEEELKTKVLELCSDETLYTNMSQNARKTYETEMQIEVMFEGFSNAVNYVTKNKK